MEKVIEIKSVELNTTEKGVPYAKITDSNGQKHTAWDKDLIEKLGKRMGSRVSVEIKMSPDGKYSNIRGLNDASDGTVLKEVQNGERSLNGQEQRPESVSKDKSIIAQCLVKGCLRQVTGTTVKEAVEMYKEALELLG